MENPRLVKALSEKMCLMSATQSETEWAFRVRGQTNTVYDQVLNATTYSCSCPDQQGKKSFCKHLLFLVVRAGKQYELGAELAQRPKTSWKKSAFVACSASWSKCLAHLVSSAPAEPMDGVCTICYEDIGTEPLVNCSATCKKHFHKVCMERWLEHGKTCPLCRSDWSAGPENTFITSTETITGHVLTDKEEVPDVKTDLVISFDTTGSMYPCLSEVRRHTTTMCERLFREIPSLRVAIIAHGDYCDGDKVISQQDFTSDQEQIKQFIQNAPSTSGGDFPECYELVLRTVKGLSWRPDATMKSLILIGDAPPHEKNENPQKIDWREEAESLNNRNIQVFSVQCLNNGNKESFKFYSEVAMATNGDHVFLDQFSYIKDMIQAICFKQYNQDHLAQFEKEVQEGGGGMSHSMRLMFDTMLGKKTREQARDEMHPDRFREKYSRSRPSHTHSVTHSSHMHSATPSLDRESDLRSSPPSRFQVFAVDEDINIKDFCTKMGVTFKNGRGFYEFTKPEIIGKKKEIVLMERATCELYEGAAARAIAGIKEDDDNARVKPGELPKYRMFIQSTSPARKLVAKQGFLYEVDV